MSNQAEEQIALWEQRLLRGKLHLPYFTADPQLGPDGIMDLAASLDTINMHPICGRQLNNHRGQRAQLADQIEFATSLPEFTYQLMGKRACRHCAIKAGLLVRAPQTSREPQDGEDCSDEEGEQ